MKSLMSVLSEFSQTETKPSGKLGGGATRDAEGTVEDEQQWELLRQRLKETMKGDRIWLYLYAGMVVAAFVAAIVIVFFQPGTAKYVLPTSGGLLMLLIRQMRSMWREQVATSMLLELSLQLKGDVLTSIIHVLLQWMSRGGKHGS